MKQNVLYIFVILENFTKVNPIFFYVVHANSKINYSIMLIMLNSLLNIVVTP